MNYTILIVDDEDRILELLDETFRKKGFTTQCASDGDQALKMLCKNRPDIMISDIMLPRMDGFTLVDKIREREDCKNLPIILMSAVYRDLQVRNKAEGKYGVDFLVKPFSLSDLMARVKKRLAEGLVEEEGFVDESEILRSEKKTGKLEHFSFPLVLISFFSTKKTGVLTLKQGPRILKIYLENGVPNFAEGKTRKDNPDEVHRLLLNAMGWSQGEYEFIDHTTLPPNIPRYPHDFYGIVYEGAKRYYRLELLIGKFQDHQNDAVFRQESFDTVLSKVQFTPEDLQIVSQIDGKKTVGELAAQGQGNLNQVFQTLWLLQFLEAIEFKKTQ